MKKKIAIVGTGVAGMSAAFFLKEEYDITVYEKNSYIGGHTNTVYVEEDGKNLPIDTGFMVFNEVTYPNLIKLFNKLDVPYVDTDMSFGVRHNQSNLEYNGSNVDGLFAQRKNIFSLKHYKFLLDINKFNKIAPKYLEQNESNLSIRDYVKENNFSKDFYDKFLVPMSSAVWSTPTGKMGDFPAKSLIRFFYNHGFMGLDTQHQWKTVVGGSESYKSKLIESFKDQITTELGAKTVEEKDGKVIVEDTAGSLKEYDKVVFASHADETLRLLKFPTLEQKKLLSPFKYQENIAVLHTDSNVMPKIKKVWSAWNYVIPNKTESYTVYWMNKLQSVSEKKDYFININGESYIDESKIIKRIVYHHPIFDEGTQKSQETLFSLNRDKSPVFFCGSYFKYGFHEDALTSSVNLCSYLLGKDVL